MNRIIYVPGDRVSLVVPEKQDIEVMYIGINNPENKKYLGPIFACSYESEEAFYDSIAKGDGHSFMIMLNEGQKIIGNVGNVKYAVNDRNLEVGICIYLPEYQSKGYGTEAMKLYLKYCFEMLGCHKVKLGVFDYNERGYKSYLKCGFQEVGRYKEDAYIMGQYRDSLHMEIMRSEYEKLYLNK